MKNLSNMQFRFKAKEQLIKLQRVPASGAREGPGEVSQLQDRPGAHSRAATHTCAAEQPFEHAMLYLHLPLAEKSYTHEKLPAAAEWECTIEVRRAASEKKSCQPLTFDGTQNMRDYRLHGGEVYQIFRQNEIGGLFSHDVTETANDPLCHIIEKLSLKVLRTEQLGYLACCGREKIYGSFGEA
ncbi:insulin-degrading enzyme-like [Tropilaelaps mercedesae]|uniref:Insulin-degrading enzyme-like n=1 Tax=Tropilaelaps mercedesae TaxID=418985 RepID=A0A1V9XNS7_9ACAR|nr:insulin-degrading enzyme-like [Tropilaelaps mercedesae]